ncbi:hypothetical protein PQB34_gp29 [Ochrobactrum phage POI1126]|uniref:Uncharacterized protein n=1 Tax=Ochrobactrum phage POI1126 TaxID=1932118 RepID=A0A240F4T2_9CAUD|nr:hypothetical protein PQB34_gp29 [Ochrobactrum phage POI1126]APU92957.1 hypothetical protein POI1126_29 [Ochrobactrum phage POI1126]
MIVPVSAAKAESVEPASAPGEMGFPGNCSVSLAAEQE